MLAHKLYTQKHKGLVLPLPYLGVTFFVIFTDDGWHQSTKAMITMGLIGIIISIIIAVLFIFVSRLQYYRKILIFALLIVISLTGKA